MMIDDKLIEEKMTDATDQELDALIADVFQRQAVLESIHREIMTDIRQHSRSILLRRWLRIAAFAFGVPFILLCFAFGMYQIFVHSDTRQPYMWAVIILPTLTILAYTNKWLKDFSITEV